MNYAERLRQLTNLVNTRRVQVGKEPLRTAHIERAAQFVLGPPPQTQPTIIYPGSWLWDLRVPYALTEKAKAFLAAGIVP